MTATKKSGETLVEIIFAVTILTAFLTIIFQILSRTVDLNFGIKNRVIALNLAREGLEGVRNIRDTNWLKYSDDRRRKWICHDTITNLNCSNFLETNQNYFYKINFSENHGRFFLEKISDAEKLDLKINSAEKGEFLLQKNSDGRFLHDKNFPGSKFFRQIEIEIKNPFEAATDGADTPKNACDTAAENCTNSQMRVVSRVQWFENEKVFSVALETNLFDFFDRKNFSQ